MPVLNYTPIHLIVIEPDSGTRKRARGIYRVDGIHPNFVQTHLLNFEILHRSSKNFDLLGAQEEKSGVHQSH